MSLSWWKWTHKRKHEDIRKQIHIFLNIKNSLCFLVGSSVHSQFFFHPTFIILVYTFINLPFISSWISSKLHVCDLCFTPSSPCAVLGHFISLFISRRTDKCVFGVTSKVLVSFTRGMYLSAVSCVILSKELQTVRVRVTLWGSSGTFDNACNETHYCVCCHSDFPGNICQVVTLVCHE
jgi:hypothetical protein